MLDGQRARMPPSDVGEGDLAAAEIKRRMTHRSGGDHGFAYVSPPIIRQQMLQSQSLPALPGQPQGERAFPKDARSRNEVLKAYGGVGISNQQRRKSKGGSSPQRASGQQHHHHAHAAGRYDHLVPKGLMPPGSLPRLPAPNPPQPGQMSQIGGQPTAVASSSSNVSPAAADGSSGGDGRSFRSPLLTLEVKLMQAMSGAERSPTPHRAAACFEALRGLLAAVSLPFRPLLQTLSRELWAAVYDSSRGGVAHFDEVFRLRALVAQRDGELAKARAEMRRRDHELDILRSELASTDTGGFMEEVKVEVVSLKKKKKGDGLGFAKVTSEAAGRNVFDRVDEGARKFKKLPGQRNFGLYERAANRVAMNGLDDPASSPNAAARDDSANDEGDRPSPSPASKPQAGAASGEDADGGASGEVMRLRAALLDSVPRVDYERVNEELESMTKRLAEAISAQRAAMAIAEEEPLEAASPSKGRGPHTPRPDWDAILSRASASGEIPGLQLNQASAVNAAALAGALSEIMRSGTKSRKVSNDNVQGVGGGARTRDAMDPGDSRSGGTRERIEEPLAARARASVSRGSLPRAA